MTSRLVLSEHAQCDFPRRRHDGVGPVVRSVQNISRWVLALAFSLSVSAANAEQALSNAEQHLFLDPHLANVGAAIALRYSYERSGSAETSFQDEVKVVLGGKVSPTQRKAHVDFLSGDRALKLPDAESVSGNPVILSFLERDVREMQRLTKGQANYFRKRVRMALADTATVEQTRVDWAGTMVPAWKISLKPFLKDPLRPRFERLAAKSYEFLLSEQVPGGVYEMRTRVDDAAGAPFIHEVMRYQGSEP